MAHVKYLIIGGGNAGATAAFTLRDLDADGSILIVGGETDVPYKRYTLSKDYLRGQRPAGRMPIKPLEDYDKANIDARLGVRATSVNADGRSVTLDNGDTVTFEKLLLATGATPKRLSLPGFDMEGVFYLRSREDSDRIKSQVRTGRSALVIGGGFIGAEVGASLTMMGVKATVVGDTRVLWEHVVGEEMGRFFQSALQGRGVDLRMGSKVTRLEGAGKVERAVLSDGTTVPCDFAIVGVGVKPETTLAESAGLKVENGVVVDAYLKTENPNIFAAGDVARFYHPLFGAPMRIEHWEVAGYHGQCAARNMAGEEIIVDLAPEFFSDIFDLHIEWYGYAPKWDSIVKRRVDAEKFTAVYLKDEKVIAALLVNNKEDVPLARTLVQRHTLVHDPDSLLSPALDPARMQ
jgi:3-phenylpropionate/trans-cinnamate dioxygenase ferredoxin reductase subunit